MLVIQWLRFISQAELSYMLQSRALQAWDSGYRPFSVIKSYIYYKIWFLSVFYYC